MIEKMKKIILMVSLAAFALVSCNRDFVVDKNQGSAIEFRTAVDTRATELTMDNIPEFYVTALYEDGSLYFADTFTRPAGSSTYEYFATKEYFWPADDYLQFYAYYPSAEQLGVEVKINSTEKGFNGYTPNPNIGLQEDLITAAMRTNKENSQGGVELEFVHQLSQIEIKAKNANDSYTVKVKEVQIKNVAGSGDFSFVAVGNDWTPSADVTASYSIAADSPITLGASYESLMGVNGNAMLIPQKRIAWGPAVANTVEAEGEGEVVEGEGEETPETPATPAEPETDPTGAYIAFLVQVDAVSGSRIFPLVGDYGWVVLPVAFDWVSGYKYTYSCDFSQGIGIDPTTGKEILGGKIIFNEIFGSWSSGPSEWYTADM